MPALLGKDEPPLSRGRRLPATGHILNARILRTLRWLSDGPSELVLFIGTTGTAGCSKGARKEDGIGRIDLNAVAGVIGAKLDCLMPALLAN